MTARIGQQVVKLRGDRSAKWLSEKTAELGFPISRSALSQLETNNRESISLAEFLILAAALEVPPLLLLYPEYPDGKIEMLPDVFATAFNAGEWIGGDQALNLNEKEVGLGYPGNLLIANAKLRHKIVSDGTKRLQKLMEQKGSFDFIPLLNELESQRDALNASIEHLGGTVDYG